MSKKPRVLLAMSGGVDSSAAAALLVEQGYDVVGVTMQVWDYSANQCDIESGNGTCCSSIDVDDARAVCDVLGIPFYVINCESKFKETVIDDFVGSYLEGRTPIPCVNCNTFLKFDHLVKKMYELDCDYLATGHYAKVGASTKTGAPVIITSRDDWKDQTYFLFTIKPEIVPKLLFPVGDWEKPKLRSYAEEKGLPVAKKKDSTGICFIGKNDYKDFVEAHSTADDMRPGLLRRFSDGRILGEHEGIHRFTYGQRKGLGVFDEKPLYVVKIDPETHDVFLGYEEHLYSNEVVVRDPHFLDQVDVGDELRVKIRFQHKGATAKVVEKKEGRMVFQFTEPQRSVTPGQAAVMYRDQQLVGGAWIV